MNTQSRRQLMFLPFLTACYKSRETVQIGFESDFSIVVGDTALGAYSDAIGFPCNEYLVRSISIDGSAVAFCCHDTQRGEEIPTRSVVHVFSSQEAYTKVEINGVLKSTFSVSPNATSLVGLVRKPDYTNAAFFYSLTSKELHSINIAPDGIHRLINMEAHSDTLCKLQYTNGLSLMNPETGSEYCFLKDKQAALSPTGDKLASMPGSNQICITQLRNNRVDHEAILSAPNRSMLSWLPDGKHLLVLKSANVLFWRQSIEVLNITTGKFIEIFDKHFEESQNFRFISKKLLHFVSKKMQLPAR